MDTGILEQTADPSLVHIYSCRLESHSNTPNVHVGCYIDAHIAAVVLLQAHSAIPGIAINERRVSSCLIALRTPLSHAVRF